ncbi:MAG: SDR family NAD(P)-dependent oxidoreductase, partial [Thermoguttaceae bacterium]
EIKNSRVIVTGASSGIGRAVSLELAHQGAQLVVLARREERLKQLAAEVTALNAGIEIVVGDVTDPQVRQQAVETAQSNYGGLDILINNAGVGAMGLFEDADPQRLRKIFEVNVFALAEMTRLALPLLKKGRKPMVVNVSSILGHCGAPHNSEYCASKFAVQGFSDSIRAEFVRYGIDVLVVCPGTTETEFFDSVVEKTAEPNWPEHAAVSAEHVARAMVKSMRNGRHEIIPYSLGKILCRLQRLSPALMDRLMARYV